MRNHAREGPLPSGRPVLLAPGAGNGLGMRCEAGVGSEGVGGAMRPSACHSGVASAARRRVCGLQPPALGFCDNVATANHGWMRPHAFC